MGCKSGFTAYFTELTADGSKKFSLDFVYHGIGPDDWLRTIEFFDLPRTDTHGGLPEWEADVPLSRLVEYIGPLTLTDLMERHIFFRFQMEFRTEPGRERSYSQTAKVLAFLAEIERGNIPERITVFVWDMG